MYSLNSMLLTKGLRQTTDAAGNRNLQTYCETIATTQEPETEKQYSLAGEYAICRT